MRKEQIRIQSGARTFFRPALAFLLATATSFADTITQEEAITATQNWIAEGDTLGARLPEKVVAAQTYADETGNPAVHVVALEGGGFVVTSTDDSLEPILAYSKTGEFNAEEGSPLAALLEADIRARKASSDGQGEQNGRKLMSATSTVPASERGTSKAKWDRLLGRATDTGRKLLSDSGTSSIPTVYVKPLIQSKWNQSETSSGYCYNYYTPKGYPCGCVATAMAQIMRYHQYPTSYVSPKTQECSVDGVTQYLTMKGGSYDWTKMLFTPTSASSSQREAIGKLTYDCGVSVYMDYSSDGSGANIEDAANALKTTFRYYDAKCEWYSANKDSTFHSYIQNDLLSARPVLLSIYEKGSTTGHAIVADGYGYSSGALYYHLNMGWSGSHDLWYNLPNVRNYNVIQGIVYNIKPTQTTRTFTLTLDAQGGTGGTKSITLSHGAKLPSITVPSKPGYSFGGYYAFNPGTGREIQYYSATGTGLRAWDIPSDTTLIAKWSPYTCTVTLNQQGGNNGTTSVTATYGSTMPSITIPTRAGYIFSGYFSSTDGGGTQYYTASGASARSWDRTTSTSLYAKWTIIPLDEAVDNTLLSFSTYGNASWYSQTVTTHDGVDAARSGTIGNGQYTGLYTTVEGSGEISFWWKCDTGAALWGSDDVDFKIDDSIKKTINGATGWSHVTFAVKGNGLHSLSWVYTKDNSDSVLSRANCAWLDQIVWKPMASITLDPQGGSVSSSELFLERGATYGSLPEPTWANREFLGWYTSRTGGTRIYSWSTVPGEDITLYAHWREISYSCYDDDMWEYYETGGDGEWASVAASDAVDGNYVFKSGSIGHNASTWFRRTVSGPGRLTFSWRPSSEAGFDKGVFSVDGTQSAVISGVSNAWTRVVKYVYTSGDHELRWTYTKDNAVVKGDDCLYVDNIVWQPEIKVTLDGNGGTVYGSATSATWKYVDEKFGYLTTPVRDGYRFDGWFTARNGGSRVSYDTVFSASLTTLYAHWLEETPLDKAADTDQALTTGGSSSWFGQTAVGYRGGNAVRSGALDYGQNNWLELKTSGAGRLRFAWKLDGYQSLSSTYSDALSFLVDGAVTNTVYGKQDWEEKLFYFGSGSHTFRWKFAKNGFSPSGADCAWVDAIEWSPLTHLIFDANGGTIESDVFSGYAGDFFVPMEIPARAGYTFLGWYTLPEGGELVASAWEAIELKKSCALYAHWGFTTLSASTFSSEYVYLYWGYVTGASTYQIYRSTEDVRPSTPLPLDYTLSWTGYFDYTATPGVSYRYWIEVLDANGESLGVTEPAIGRRKVTLSCPTDVIETGAADDVMQLTLEANTSWTAVSDAPWVTLYSASGTGNGEFYALIASNTTVSARSCAVTVTAGAGTDEPVSISIKVYQDAATTIEPQPEPEPDNGGGTSDGAGGPSSAWTATKAKTLYGAVRTADGELAGVVQLKVAKPNARTKATKLYGSVTLLDGKKRTMKSVSVSLPADKPASVKTSVKGLGTLEIEFGDDGFAGTLGGYTVESAEVGGKWTRTDAAVYLDFGDSPDGSLASLFPNGEPVHAKAGKWTFDKAASVKLANGGLVVDISKKRTNLSGLKLTYTPKTGVFKGSFKLYAIQNGKLKKYTVKVTGVVVGGVGTGVAKLAKPSFTGTVSVE